jgi:amino acid transporter
MAQVNDPGGPQLEPASGADSHRLRKTLRLRDLVPMQILLVVGVTWPGIAAREGPTHVSFWLAGVLLLFLPVAGVVQYCSRIWPYEGGVYQWTRHALGPFCGFISAWNFGLWALLIVSAIGLQTATSLSYSLGPQAAWMAGSGTLVTLLNCVIFGFMLLINIRGLGVGRWVAHFGTAATLSITLLLILLLFVHPLADGAHPHLAPQAPFSLALPALTLMTLNLFGKLAFNGLTGLEQVAVFAGEMRRPERDILRSAWIVAPMVALIYILMSGALLEYTAADQIDLVGPLSQVLGTAFGSAHTGGSGLGTILGRISILLVALAVIAQDTVVLAETSRLPLVAAWDHLLPAGFTRLHSRYRTPTVSLLVITALCVLLGLFAWIGAEAQEAFQVLATAANLCYAINYLLMFSVPLVAGGRFGKPPGILLRLACVAGAAVTLLSMVCALFPIVEVKDVGMYALKVGTTALVMNLIGAALFWRGHVRAARLTRVGVVGAHES